METDLLVVQDLPARETWAKYDDEPDVETVLPKFQDASRLRDQSDPKGTARWVEAEKQLKEFIDKNTIDGIVNLLPAVINEKKRKIERELDGKFLDATRQVQHWRVVAGIRIQQSIERQVKAPTWESTSPASALRHERMTARLLDVEERRHAESWLTAETTTLEHAVQRYRDTPDGQDMGFVAAFEAGTRPAIRPKSNVDVTLSLELPKLIHARRVARVAPQTLDAHRAYRAALNGTLTDQMLRAVAG